MDVISRYYEFVKWLIKKDTSEVIITSVTLTSVLFLCATALYFDPNLFELFFIMIGFALILHGSGFISYIKYNWSIFNRECPSEDVRIIKRLKGEL